MDKLMGCAPRNRPLLTKWIRRFAGGMVVLLVGAGLVAAPTNPAFADETRDKQWMIDALKLEKAWEASEGEGVTVGTVDSGVDETHPDLKGSVMPGTSYTDDSDDGRTDPDGHGTGVASLIAGHGHNDGGDGVVGIAPKAKILPAQIRAFGAEGAGEDTSDADFANAIRWLADNGADIIVIEVAHVGQEEQEHAAIKYAAIERGIPVVGGVGNVGTDYGTGELEVPRTQTLYPAGYTEVIGASATTEAGNLSDDSMYGAEVAVGAPGEDVIAAKPGNGYTNFGGTSSAAAVTAGVMALLKSAYPDDTRMELAWRLTELATEVGKKGVDDKFGYGIVNPAKALTEDPGPLPDELKDPEPTGSYPDDKTSQADDKDAAKTSDNDSGATLGTFILPAGIVAAVIVALVILALVLRQRKRKQLAPSAVGLTPYSPGGQSPEPQAPQPPPAPGSPANPGSDSPWSRPDQPRTDELRNRSRPDQPPDGFTKEP